MFAALWNCGGGALEGLHTRSYQYLFKELYSFSSSLSHSWCKWFGNWWNSSYLLVFVNQLNMILCKPHQPLFFWHNKSGDSCTLIAVGVWRFLINFDNLLIDYFRESKLVLHLILQTQSLKDQNLLSASLQHIIARFTWLWTVEPSSAF